MPEPALKTLRQIAAELGRSPRSASRLLRRTYDADAKGEHPPDWRVWGGKEGEPQLFNVSRLKRAHPEFFSRGAVDRAEFGALETRVTKLELGAQNARARVGALERKAAGV